MNTKKFSEAMGEIDDKYVEEAIRYRATKKAKSPFGSSGERSRLVYAL